MGCFNFKKGPKSKPKKSVGSEKSSNKSFQPKTYTEKSKNLSSSVKSDQSVTKSVTSTPPRCSIPDLYEQRGQKLRVFDFEELRAATNDFNRALKLGEGGFGTVFKGFLKCRDSNRERLVVAVKRLKQRSLQVQHWYCPNLYIGYDQYWHEHFPSYLLANLYVPVQLMLVGTSATEAGTVCRYQCNWCWYGIGAHQHRFCMKISNRHNFVWSDHKLLSLCTGTMTVTLY